MYLYNKNGEWTEMVGEWTEMVVFIGKDLDWNKVKTDKDK